MNNGGIGHNCGLFVPATHAGWISNWFGTRSDWRGYTRPRISYRPGIPNANGKHRPAALFATINSHVQSHDVSSLHFV
jgi:hypothetical protein